MNARIPPLPVCGLCGHDLDNRDCGTAGVLEDGKATRLCHADGHSCYHQWTVYGARINQEDNDE